MTVKRLLEKNWHRTKAGVLVPTGTTSSYTQTATRTYLDVKAKAIEVEQLYEVNEVLLPPSCDLAGLIADAKRLSDSWLLNQMDQMPIEVLFRVGHLDRLGDAILPLASVPERTRYLERFASGSLDLLERQKSDSKNIFWEVELWTVLRSRGFDAHLREPPDIVVEFESASLGIACKKFYSEKHVQNVLSEAVSQIEESFDFGIVALNLDDLVPPNQILRMPTQQAMGQFIHELNLSFLKRHERHFRKYLASGRLLSALVSTSVLADIRTGGTRFNNARQVTIWTIPGLPPEKDRQLRRFYEQLMR